MRHLVTKSVATLLLAGVALATDAASPTLSPPASFAQAKRLAAEIYADHRLDGYCGCPFTADRRVLPASCGYVPRRNLERGLRIEWEHVVPASKLAADQALPCWRGPGDKRQNCRSNDPWFRAAEADLHNLLPVVGELNADRSNYRLGIVPGEPRAYGACDFEVQDRVAEPPPAVRGDLARIYFYMADTYGVRIARRDRSLYEQWHQADPVDAWERERDRRIALLQGNANPWVSGKPADRVVFDRAAAGRAPARGARAGPPHAERAVREVTGAVIGNRRSRVYHLPACPAYDQVAAQNQVRFADEAAAAAAGYRRAGNCLP